MSKVTGLGGIFFKSKSPKDLMAWYKGHLGIEPEDWGGKVFQWREKDNPEERRLHGVHPFKADTSTSSPRPSRTCSIFASTICTA
jgi:hypothetical protein